MKNEDKKVYLSTLRSGEWFKFVPASAWCLYFGISGGKHVYHKPYSDTPTYTTVDHKVIRRHDND